jgi:foldase protein PrsA
MLSIRQPVAFLVLFLLAGAALVTAQEVGPAQPAAQEPSLEPLPQGVVAVVNGEPITEAEWLATLKRVAGRAVLDVIIRHKVVHQAAAQQGISVSDAELTAIFDKKVAEVGGMQQLQSQLQQIGETVEDFRARLRTETLLHRITEKRVTVSDDEVKKFFLERYGRKAEVQAIVVGTREAADVVLKQLKAGDDFAQLAAKASTDQTTAQNHGFIPVPVSEGFFPKPMGGILMTEAIAEEIFKLKEGQTTGVIPGASQDFYIFRLARLTPAQDVKFEDKKDEVRRDALEYKIQAQSGRILQELLTAAKIRTGI